MTQTRCPICEAPVHLLFAELPGYIAGQSYDILECSKCSASFADPLIADERVYESIYRNSEILVGYERYHRYSRLVKRFPNPLTFLASTESSYWSVISEIQKDIRPPDNIRILEIGSGLGYLTYALNHAGYRATGIDVSHEAVRRASVNYGDFFHVKDLHTLHREDQRYDYVLMMDVIEHVEDPVSFVQAAVGLLKEGGALLVTTPNKTSTSLKSSVWQSDVPPVHLWFMAESTLTHIAERLGYSCRFVDFSEFNRKYYSLQYNASIEDVKSQVPRLNLDGTVLPSARTGRYMHPLLLVLRYMISYMRRRLHRKIYSNRSTVLCAIFEKSSGA